MRTGLRIGLAFCLAVLSLPLAAQDRIDRVRPDLISRNALLRKVDWSSISKRHQLSQDSLRTQVPGLVLTLQKLEPATPTEGVQVLTVEYILTNLSFKQAGGIITGSYNGQSLTHSDGAKSQIIDLAPAASVSGALALREPLPSGPGRITVRYLDQPSCIKRPTPAGTFVESCVYAIERTEAMDVLVPAKPDLPDSDNDGVIDADETLMLRRFRPYYRFSKNGDDEEPYRPADPLTAVRGGQLYDERTEVDSDHLVFDTSTLANDPTKILMASTVGSSLTSINGSESSYHLNVDNSYRSGESNWDYIRANAVGLFGHVSPLREGQDGTITGYKIEYWQYFSFNPVRAEIECSRYEAHEGDWEGIELVIDGDKTTIRRVTHHIHSSDVVFNRSKAKIVDIPGSFQEWQGTGFDRPYRGYIDLYVEGPAGIGRAQDNLARFYCDSDGCTHPVAYIEYGGHAMWPTEHWVWPWVYNHDGNSEHNYLVATPPNLGEIEAPNTECVACHLVVGFNGNWGACGKDPPNGPPTKGSWGRP